MKKLFSILAAVLFAGSMMAVTLDPGTQTAVTPTNTNAGDPISLTINGIQIDYTGALGAANPTATPPVPADFRVFAGKTLTLTATSNISKVVIAGKANKKDFTATVDKGTVTTGASYAEITEKAELTDPLIVVENINATSVTLTVGKQLRAYMIEVTLGEGEEPVEPGDEPVVEPAALITFGDTAVAKGTWSNGAVIADKDSLVKLTLVDPEAKIAIDLNEANFGTTEEYVTLKSRLKTGGKSSSSKNYINVEVAKNGKLYIMARTGSNSATDRNVVITNGTDTIFNQLLLESNATVVPLTDSTSMKIYPVYSATLNTGVTYRISYPVNGVNFYGFDFVPEDEPVVEPEGPKNLGAKTIAEFLELKNTTDTCILTGVVSNIQNTTYGNFDLTDESGKVYVYGLLTPAGESKKFADLNVAENDTLTVLAIYNEHKGNPQVKNAIFVEVKKSSAPVEPAVNLGAKTIAEFLALKNTKDTCILTGVVSNIQNEEYGNFDLVDETGSVYIYGLLTPEGEAKKFAELGVEAGDTLTVLAVYSEYNGEPQVKNAIFVDLGKGEGGGSEGEFTYDYEPEEVSTFDVEMSTSEVEDYTAEFGVVAMYFESADGSYFASMELIISSEDLVEPGEYQINDSEEEGTFFASPGGDDEYDYGCYFGYAFIDPEDGQEYYYPYYLVSGNVTITEDGIQVQAKSYNGSTVKFTYVQPYDAVENTKLTDKLLKAIENGNVIIKSGNVIFDVNGQRIK